MCWALTSVRPNALHLPFLLSWLASLTKPLYRIMPSWSFKTINTTKTSLTSHPYLLFNLYIIQAFDISTFTLPIHFSTCTTDQFGISGVHFLKTSHIGSLSYCSLPPWTYFHLELLSSLCFLIVVISHNILLWSGFFSLNCWMNLNGK